MTTMALSRNHWMCNLHMCMLAIVMATYSYGITYGGQVVIGNYGLVLLNTNNFV